MDIYFDIDLIDNEVRSVFFLSTEGHFYAEPISNGIRIEELKYNDTIFHLEADPEHKEIELKESIDNVIQGLSGWLARYPEKNMITYIKDETKFKLITDLIGLDLSDCNIHEMDLKDDVEITNRISLLKLNYENIFNNNNG